MIGNDGAAGGEDSGGGWVAGTRKFVMGID